MPLKTVAIADPGIDTAFALALALNDPIIDVVGVGATAGNDGQNTYAWPSNVSNVPVELIERNSGLFIDRKELRPGSGGTEPAQGTDRAAPHVRVLVTEVPLNG